MEVGDRKARKGERQGVEREDRQISAPQGVNSLMSPSFQIFVSFTFDLVTKLDSLLGTISLIRPYWSFDKISEPFSKYRLVDGYCHAQELVSDFHIVHSLVNISVLKAPRTANLHFQNT